MGHKIRTPNISCIMHQKQLKTVTYGLGHTIRTPTALVTIQVHSLTDSTHTHVRAHTHNRKILYSDTQRQRRVIRGVFLSTKKSPAVMRTSSSPSSMSLCVQRDRRTTGEPTTSTSAFTTFTQFLSSVMKTMVGWMLLYVHRNRRLIRGGREPRTATSTFTQLLNSKNDLVWVLLYGHRNRRL